MLPVLIIFVLAVSQLGFLVYVQNILEQSSREGVRIISTTNSNQLAYKTVYKLCKNLEKDKLKVAISPEDKEIRKIGNMANIEITYNYKGIFNVINMLMNKDLILRAESSMRMECN